MQEPQSPVPSDVASEILTDMRLKQCVAFVEATYFEALFLQERYGGPLRWESVDIVDTITVGCIDRDSNKKVYILVFYVKLKGKLVAFYGSTSRFVDHQMIESYIKSNYPVKYGENQEWAMFNANSFHKMLGIIK